MKLLIDQNISPQLPTAIHDLAPGSLHVSTIGYDRVSDRAIWDHARDHGFVVVSKDTDFIDLSSVLGRTPKVIRITRVSGVECVSGI